MAANSRRQTGNGALGMPTDLGAAVAISLRDRILDGTFAPGERLVETELADLFGTSRGPVRDGLSHLELSGLVVTIPRRGSFVAQLAVDDIEEIYSLRLSLEILAIARAVQRCDTDELSQLKTALGELRQAEQAGNRRKVADADMALHRMIIELAGHARLASAWERLADQTLLLMTELSEVAPEVQAAAGDHADIVEHLTAGRTAKAQAAMTAHLTAASTAMIERLGHQPDDSA